LWLLVIATSIEDAALMVLSIIIIIVIIIIIIVDVVDKQKLITLKVPRQCPLLLPINVGWQ